MGYQNFFATKLFTDIGAADTTITLETVPTETSGRLVLEARNATQREIISYTGVAGNTITGVTRGIGGTSAKTHSKNALVEMNLTAEDIEDLYDAYDNFLASNGTGWVDLVATPTLTATNGNRSFNISFAGDKTDILSKGMRLKIPRTGTTLTQSADFNGTTQYASKTSPAGITFTTQYTIEAHIWVDAYPSANCGIISRYGTSGTTSGWLLFMNSNGQLVIQGNNAGNYKRHTSTQSVPTGRWVHVAGKIDVSGTSGTLYIDGKAINSSYTINGTMSTINNTIGNLQIGAFENSNFADMRISDGRVWSTLRTDAQIRDNMNQQLTGSETGLVGYWKLNGDFNDSTANANNLTPVGGATATYAANPFNANAYAIIANDPVYSGGNTTMTVQSPNGYPIPNAALGTASYSSVKVPYEFPSDPDLWEIVTHYKTPTGVVVAASGAFDGLRITIPVGNWDVSCKPQGRFRRTSGAGIAGYLALSTSASSLQEVTGLTSFSETAGGTTQPFVTPIMPIIPYPYKVTSATELTPRFSGALSEYELHSSNTVGVSFTKADFALL